MNNGQTSTDFFLSEAYSFELFGKGLSRREVEVMEFVVLGLPNKAIARKLYVTERTVKFHCSNIYQKLDVKNRASLVHKMRAL